MPILLHSLWRYALLLVAAAPLAYYAAATLAAARFFRRERARQLPAFTPPVSVLKPVRGVDFASYENFASFCLQDYPDFELLFAVNDSADPAVELIHRLMAEFPQRQIRLFIGAQPLGANRKVNKLCRLAAAARHDILVVSDGDVRAGPRYLREVAAPFADPQTGVVTCFYRGIAQENLFAAIEAIGASSDFFAGVLMAHWLEGMSFALGATMATTKAWLAKIGGFEGLAATHSDDYELGHRIALQGGRIVLSREPVWTMYPAQSARGFWEHLGASGALGAHRAPLPPAFLRRSDLHARPALGPARRAPRSRQSLGRRLARRLAPPAPAAGLGGRRVGRRRRRSAPQALARALPRRSVLCRLARQFYFQSHHLGRRRVRDAKGPDDRRRRRQPCRRGPFHTPAQLAAGTLNSFSLRSLCRISYFEFRLSPPPGLTLGAFLIKVEEMNRGCRDTRSCRGSFLFLPAGRSSNR
ncbi:MAG: glycosyltransferase [Acidobacteriia bacterium]|nr:glycosyltransferase [Terriglobia bacterium]